MKKITLLFASALAFAALFSCSDEEEIYPGRDDKQNEEAYAAQATVTSSDSNFTATDNGGTIQFKTEGGSATLTVNCGCDWIAENSAADLFATSKTSTSLSITAVQNTVEEDLTGTITLMTENYRITFATVTITQTAYGAPTISVETTEWHAPAAGDLTTDIAVTASDDWTAESAGAWLTVVKTSDGITLTAEENGETTERSTKITLTCTDGIRTAREYINVNQDAKVYLTISEEKLNFASEEDSAAVTVDSNFDWDYSYDTTNSWLKFSRNGNVLTITASANEEDDDREATVIFTAGDGAANVAEEQLNISQQASTENDMVFTYTITSTNVNKATQLPLYGEVDCTVNWGDGSDVETITSTQPSHTYTTTGEYDITIKGKVTALYSSGISSSSSPLPITEVKQWGNTGLTDMQYAFYYCSNLVSVPSLEGFSEVTSFARVFYYCSKLKAAPSFKNCTAATSFQYAFYNCTALTTIPDGIFTNCSSVTNFGYLFQNCAITSLPNGMFEGCTSATNYQNAFYGCSSLKSVPDDLFKNNTKVTHFSATFYNCTGLESIPEGFFSGCSSATTFTQVFYNCSSIKSIPAHLFDGCESVTTLTYVFFGCSGLTEVTDATLFASCTKATDFSRVFASCSSLTTVVDGIFANNPLVTKFEYAFYGDSSLTEVPENLFANCPEVTSFNYAFQNCSKLVTVPTGLFDNNLKAVTFNTTFRSCSSVVGESPYTEIGVEGETVKVHLYDRANYTSELGCSAPTTYSNCFNGSSFSDMDYIPSTWGGNF